MPQICSGGWGVGGAPKRAPKRRSVSVVKKPTNHRPRTTRAVQHLGAKAGFCPDRVPGRKRITSFELGPTFSEMGPPSANIGPKLTNLEQASLNGAKFGTDIWLPDLARHWPILTTSRRELRVLPRMSNIGGWENGHAVSHGGRRKIWPESASQISDSDWNRCNRLFSTSQRRIWLSQENPDWDRC